MVKLILIAFLAPLMAFASYSPTSNIYDSSGNALNSTSNALNAYLTNSSLSVSGSLGRSWSLLNSTDSVNAVQSGTWTTGRTWSLLNTTDSVNVGNFPSSFSVSNFPATQAVTQSGTWSEGRTWTLLNTTDSVNVGNFPSTQTVSGSLGRTWSLLNTTDSVNVGNFPSSFSVSNFPATQPVSATALPLPANAAQETGGNLATIATNTTGVATAANQSTMITTLNAIDAGLPTSLGAKTTANSTAVNIASDQTVQTTLADLYVTGQATQTATVNNILTATAGTAATDLLGYHSVSVQVTSTGTGGTFIFEGSNDNTNFQTIPVWNQLVLTGTPITAAITASASQLVYVFPVTTRYARLRIATTITGGSIQAFSKYSQTAWTPGIFQVAQATSGNLNVNVGSLPTLATVSTVTNGNLGFPGIITDVASAALTTTTTTAAFSPTYGNSFTVNIPVTVVSGTTPTLDVEIQESDDTGTNWFAVYDFPRITATGSYRSPPIVSYGNRFRYVQAVAGTTPSFTRAINRLQRSTADRAFRQMIDRTVSLTTLSSVTGTLSTFGTSNLMLEINIGAATTAPALQLQCSDDAGGTYYKIGTPLTAVASSTVAVTIPNMSCQFVQAIVTTAGSAVTAGYVLVRGF